jgi:hypothetical protein
MTVKASGYLCRSTSLPANYCGLFLTNKFYSEEKRMLCGVMKRKTVAVFRVILTALH